MSDKNNILLPSSGTAIPESDPNETELSTESKREDESYLPAFLKRNDEFKAHPDDILKRAIEEDIEQLTRPALSLFLSAIAADMIGRSLFVAILNFAYI